MAGRRPLEGACVGVEQAVEERHEPFITGIADEADIKYGEKLAQPGAVKVCV